MTLAGGDVAWPSAAQSAAASLPDGLKPDARRGCASRQPRRPDIDPSH
jgi:hypothetical protein